MPSVKHQNAANLRNIFSGFLLYASCSRCHFCWILLEVPLCYLLYRKVSLVLLLYAQKPKITFLGYLSSRLKTVSQDGCIVRAHISRVYSFRLVRRKNRPRILQIDRSRPETYREAFFAFKISSPSSVRRRSHEWRSQRRRSCLARLWERRLRGTARQRERRLH